MQNSAIEQTSDEYREKIYMKFKNIKNRSIYNSQLQQLKYIICARQYNDSVEARESCEL